MRVDLTFSPADLKATRDLTPNIRLFEIAPAAGAAPYAPGSHINLGVMIGERPDMRSYSLVGEPDPACYRIAVQRKHDGRGGSRSLWALAPGARLSVSAPNNLFPLGLDAPDYLLVAGGIGITPLLGMAATLARRAARLRMLYAARSRAELAFGHALAALLGDRLTVFVSDEGRRIDPAAAIAGLDPRGELYLCGPMRLVDAFRQAWAAAARPAAGFRIETFGSSGAFAPENFQVKIPRLGLELTVPADRSMLEALEAAGVEVVADCRRGECGLCTLDVLEVEGSLDHRDVFLSEQQKREGRKICTCVSRAVGGALTIEPAWRGD
jgi:ferredoxin-NADP reductase